MPAAHAAVSPPSGSFTNVTNGVAYCFSVTDSKPETVTFTAEDTSDGIQLTPTTTPVLPFVTPPAAAASLIAGPSEVTADGMTPADITVTLQDSLGRPTPGKLIQISQTGGDSVISGPNPPVTNASGQIEFTAVDSNNETITYSAVDVTDGNLPFPETGTVTFSDAPEPGCSNTFVAAPGLCRAAVRDRLHRGELLRLAASACADARARSGWRSTGAAICLWSISRPGTSTIFWLVVASQTPAHC